MTCNMLLWTHSLAWCRVIDVKNHMKEQQMVVTVKWNSKWVMDDESVQNDNELVYVQNDNFYLFFIFSYFLFFFSFWVVR